MKNLATRFLSNEAGATAIEYALIASFISMAIVATLDVVGLNLNSTFTKVKTGFE